jgi:hypothetical protein
MGAQLLFDRIVVVEDSRKQSYTVEQFLKLPLPARVKYLLDRTAEFFNGQTLVERRLALANLREHLAAAN